MKKIEILTKYTMFVDDNLFVEIEEYMEMTMTASTEALYLVLSFPNVEIIFFSKEHSLFWQKKIRIKF